jgi:predicted DNA-binding antitoxin AbrB/MazE fold protein
MEKLDIEVVYENGVLKLPHDLPLPRGQVLTITIHPVTAGPRRRRCLIDWKGSQEDLDYLIMSEENGPLEAS